MLEDINALWQIFDDEDNESQDLAILTKVSCFISSGGEIPNRDKEMFERFLECTRNGGFLTIEERKFLINYAILLKSSFLNINDQMRDSSSVLDVWPQQYNKSWWVKEFNDLALGVHRKEGFLWLIRKYEVLGNTFLSKRNYSKEFYGLELARVLEIEKCRIREDEYPMVADFLNFAESFINQGLDLPYDEKQTLGAMRKLIWKITLGITRYS